MSNIYCHPMPKKISVEEDDFKDDMLIEQHQRDESQISQLNRSKTEKNSIDHKLTDYESSASYNWKEYQELEMSISNIGDDSTENGGNTNR